MTRRIALRIALGGAGATTEGASLVTAFTGRVFGVLAATPGNVVVSPYSVALALGMTRNGALAKGVLDAATIARGDGWSGVRLPYAGGGLAMTVILPEVGADRGVLALMATNLRGVLASFTGTASVTLTMPRFRFGFGASLKDLLSGLGMADAFDLTRADFGGMTTQEQLFVSDVIHRAVVAVDEEGTEASAATMVTRRSAVPGSRRTS